jgi:hypothetical protein
MAFPVRRIRQRLTTNRPSQAIRIQAVPGILVVMLPVRQAGKASADRPSLSPAAFHDAPIAAEIKAGFSG